MRMPYHSFLFGGFLHLPTGWAGPGGDGGDGGFGGPLGGVGGPGRDGGPGGCGTAAADDSCAKHKPTGRRSMKRMLVGQTLAG